MDGQCWILSVLLTGDELDKPPAGLSWTTDRGGMMLIVESVSKIFSISCPAFLISEHPGYRQSE